MEPEQELEAEIALLRHVAQGDRAGFEELYDRFSRVLFSTAYRVLNHQEATEDVLQHVFIHYRISDGKLVAFRVVPGGARPHAPPARSAGSGVICD